MNTDVTKKPEDPNKLRRCETLGIILSTVLMDCLPTYLILASRIWSFRELSSTINCSCFGITTFIEGLLMVRSSFNGG